MVYTDEAWKRHSSDVSIWKGCMQCPTDIARYVDAFTRKRQQDTEEVQDWILNELHSQMHLVKEACNAIRHYDPTRLKEAYRVIQAVRQLLQHKNTITYISSDTDKYDEFRLVHQLYYGGCDSIGRFETDIDTFLQFLEDNVASL